MNKTTEEMIETLFNNVDWSDVDVCSLEEQIMKNPEEAGRHFTLFLKNGARIENYEPRVIKIDRSVPFDPRSFVGIQWQIDSEDDRSVCIKEIDLDCITLYSTLSEYEKSILGEMRISRLSKKDLIPMDAGVFKTLWENQILIPSKWKEKTNGDITPIFFDGTILKDCNGRRCVIYLFWRDGWHWDLYPLFCDIFQNFLSAVIKM